MAQISRPQGGLRATYPDSGAYTAVEWAERIAPFHSGDDFDDSGVIPNNANYLNCTTAAGDITVDTGICCVHGHVLINDSAVTISPTHPGAPDTYTVVAVQNDTAVAYNTNLDTPAPYAAGVPAYSTRLAILQDTTLVQNASYWMIPIFTFDINAAGAVSNLTDAREWIDTRDMIDNTDDTGIADAVQIGTHAVTDTGGDTGMGVAIRAWLANAADTFLSVGRLVWRWSVATAASERSRIEFRTMFQSNETLSGVLEGPGTASPDGNARGDAAVDFQGWRAAAAEVASGNYSTISGGRENTASGSYSTVSGGADNTSSGSMCTIGGGMDNSAAGTGCTIAGGEDGTVANDNSTIAGGKNNTADAAYAFVGGGLGNGATASYAAACGGNANDASGTYSAIGGGAANGATASYSSVPGGAYGVADKYAQCAHASGYFANAGDAQGTIQMVARGTETHGDNTWRTLYLDGAAAAQRMTIAASTAWTFEVHIVGITQNAAKQWSYAINGLIERDNANNTTLAASNVTTIFESDANFDAQVVADDVNEALAVQVRDAGSSGDTVRWVAKTFTSECTYP
jgi:hypothetical protein